MPRKPKGVIKDSAFYAAIGRKGGLSNKKKRLRENPNYYSEIGTKGGQSMLKRGKEYFSMIGKISSDRARLLREDQ